MMTKGRTVAAEVVAASRAVSSALSMQSSSILASENQRKKKKGKGSKGRKKAKEKEGETFWKQGSHLSSDEPQPVSDAPDESHWEPCNDGVRVKFLVQPGAKATELVGKVDDRLKVRVQAPPMDGKANKALTAWVAKQCGVGKSRVSVIKGHTSKEKTLLIEGVSDASAPFNDLGVS